MIGLHITVSNRDKPVDGLREEMNDLALAILAGVAETIVRLFQ